MVVYHISGNDNENAYHVLDWASPTRHFYTIDELGFDKKWRDPNNAARYICETLHGDATQAGATGYLCQYSPPATPTPAPTPKKVCATGYILDVNNNCVLMPSTAPAALPSAPTTIDQCAGVPDGDYTFGTCKGGKSVGVAAPPAQQYVVNPPPPPATQQTPSPNQPSAPTPQQAPTGTQAVKYTCKDGNDIFIDPKLLNTGINPEDLCGAINMPAPGQPLTPEQQKAQDAINAAKAVDKFNSGQQLTPKEQQDVNKYFTISPTTPAKDNTGMYIALGAGALALALLFGGKK